MGGTKKQQEKVLAKKMERLQKLRIAQKKSGKSMFVTFEMADKEGLLEDVLWSDEEKSEETDTETNDSDDEESAQAKATPAQAPGLKPSKSKKKKKDSNPRLLSDSEDDEKKVKARKGLSVKLRMPSFHKDLPMMRGPPGSNKDKKKQPTKAAGPKKTSKNEEKKPASKTKIATKHAAPVQHLRKVDAKLIKAKKKDATELSMSAAAMSQRISRFNNAEAQLTASQARLEMKQDPSEDAIDVQNASLNKMADVVKEQTNLAAGWYTISEDISAFMRVGMALRRGSSWLDEQVAAASHGMSGCRGKSQAKSEHKPFKTGVERDTKKGRAVSLKIQNAEAKKQLVEWEIRLHNKTYLLIKSSRIGQVLDKDKRILECPAGFGCFANREFKRGDVVGLYYGTRVIGEDFRRKGDSEYHWKIDKSSRIEPGRDNLWMGMHFINDPNFDKEPDSEGYDKSVYNVRIDQRTMVVYARRTIKADEELYLEYAKNKV